MRSWTYFRVGPLLTQPAVRTVRPDKVALHLLTNTHARDHFHLLLLGSPVTHRKYGTRGHRGEITVFYLSYRAGRYAYEGSEKAGVDPRPSETLATVTLVKRWSP